MGISLGVVGFEDLVCLVDGRLTVAAVYSWVGTGVRGVMRFRFEMVG